MWIIKYHPDAEIELDDLDNSQRAPVFKKIQRVSANPLPISEGGYGKPLGNRTDTKLAGYCKIVLTALGIRVVYNPLRDKKIMYILTISKREDEVAYQIASSRK